MRVFENLEQAYSEIQRDLYKSPSVVSTRVQNKVGLSLDGREAFGYTYAILGGIPESIPDLISFGQDHDLPLYVEHPDEMEEWLSYEVQDRLFPDSALTLPAADELNPALKTVMEGEHFGYTYRERLVGWYDALFATLEKNRDSRRAYWPMYRQLDALRSSMPTRIPCSIGWQGMIREVNQVATLLWFYLQRSCDFQNFWLSDIWFARKMQERVAVGLDIQPGALVHFVISFHSFIDEEIY